MNTKIPSLTFIALLLLAASAAFGAQLPPAAQRVADAALAAVANAEPGLHLVVVQDDGNTPPFAQSVATAEIASGETKINKVSSNEWSHLEFTGRAVIDAKRHELILNAVIDAKVDFGSARQLKRATVGEFVVDRTEFKHTRLKQGEPHLYLFNRTTSTEESAEPVSESAALVLVWM
ncbi:MAG: hypothetical protein Q8M02_05995 [Candidatus Didemnitutus sp.]|nr:hypothetical protein [Candidatus Didemnitutus sp.]